MLLAWGLVLLGVGCGAPDLDAGEWEQDLAALRAHVFSAYANLEWQLDHRDVDLLVLDARVAAELAAAGSSAERAAALRSFLGAFDDPHVRIHEPSSGLAAWFAGDSAPGDQEPLLWSADARDAMARLGHDEDVHDFGIDVDELPAWQALPRDDSAFELGTARLADGRRLGLLRIGSFDHSDFAQCAETAWRRLAPGRSGALDEQGEIDLWNAVSQAILEQLAERVIVLREQSIDVLVVDVTGNGGGTDWVDPAARMLSGQALQAPRTGLLRHPQTGRHAEAMATVVSADLARTNLPAADRILLQAVSAALARLVAQAADPCDLSTLLERTAAGRGCSLLVREPTWASGMFPRLGPEQLVGLPSRTALFTPALWSYTEGLWAGPLIIVVDEASASATELFAAMLRDNNAAHIVGRHTLGAGFGYANGGLPLVLPNSGWTIMLPNGCRLRANGSNELAGITPDVYVQDLDNGQELSRAIKQALD